MVCTVTDFKGGCHFTNLRGGPFYQKGGGHYTSSPSTQSKRGSSSCRNLLNAASQFAVIWIFFPEDDSIIVPDPLPQKYDKASY
jgi:hypothetical protein